MSAGERRAGWAGSALLTFACVGACLAAPAAADAAPAVAQAVVAVRDSSSCPPLSYNPTVEYAAEIVNRSTYAYLNHTAENVPADDPHPTAIVKDLGIDAPKALSLQGAGRTVADAVRGVILQGRNAIPDCSYTDFGASLLNEEQTGFILAVVVLVGR